MFSKCQKAVGKMPVYDFPELKMASSKGSFCLVKMGFQFHITRGGVSGTETMNRLSKEFQVNFLPVVSALICIRWLHVIGRGASLEVFAIE